MSENERQDPAEPKQVDTSVDTEAQPDQPVESPAVVVEPAAAPVAEPQENDHSEG